MPSISLGIAQPCHACAKTPHLEQPSRRSPVSFENCGWSTGVLCSLLAGPGGAHFRGSVELTAHNGWLSKLWSFLGPLNTRCCIVLRTQKGTIVLTNIPEWRFKPPLLRPGGLQKERASQAFTSQLEAAPGSSAQARCDLSCRKASCAEAPRCRYEIEEIEGKGLGLVATWGLDAGDLIFAEAPQLSFEAESSVGMQQVREQFGRLPSKVQQEIMDLEDAWSSNGRKTLRGIIETNGIECETAGPSTNSKAVCLDLSRLNHSCNANCDYSWNQREKQMEVYAQTAIAEGEELSISYIDIREPRQVRQQMLQDNWQFRCCCSVCSRRAHIESDKRRLRMGELAALLYSSRSSTKKFRIAKKLLKLYKDEEFAMRLVSCLLSESK